MDIAFRTAKAGEDVMILKCTGVELYVYNHRVIGFRCPDNVGVRLRVGYGLTQPTREAIEKRQAQVGLMASWVKPVGEQELATLAGEQWIKAFGMFARERMQGNV